MSKDKKVAILIADKFHEEEATSPRDYLVEKGIQIDLVGLKTGPVEGKYGKFSLIPDKIIEKIKAEDYDALLIPGGGAPERLRIDKHVLKFVKEFWASGRPVGTICHGPQVLISAKLLEGVTLTCYEGIKDDVINAGAEYVDKAVCVDGQLVSSRKPADLDEFNEIFFKSLTSGLLDGADTELDGLSALALAASREKGAQEFYSGVADVVNNTGIANKFKYLAAIEVGHFDQLADMYEKLSGGKKLLVTVNMNEIGKHKVEAGITAEKAIELAINAEQKAYDFYRNAALKSRNKNTLKMFEYLAAEELEHKRLLLLDKASLESSSQGHFQWATHFDIPPGMEDLW